MTQIHTVKVQPQQPDKRQQHDSASPPAIHLSTSIRTLVAYTAPNVAFCLISYAMSFSSMLFVGRDGDSRYLASASLGNMCSNVVGMSLTQGLANALDTLCSQAYGAGEFKLVGLQAYRGMCILSLACVPVTLILMHAEQLLLLCQLDAAIASLSAQWISTLLWSLWPALMTTVLTKTLVASGVLWPTIAASLTAAVANISSNIVNYQYFDNSFLGAVTSTVISGWVMFLTLTSLVYLRRRYRKRLLQSTAQYMPLSIDIGNIASPSSLQRDGTPQPQPIDDDIWPPFTMEAFTGWQQWLALGLPSSASRFLEWASFEANAGYAAKLSTIDLATHSVMQQSCALSYMMPMALANSTAALVGNRLGSGDIREAKIFIKLSCCTVVVYALVTGLFAPILFRDQWSRVFTNDKLVQNQLHSTLPILMLYTLFDSTKVITMSVLRGAGRPTVTVKGNFVASLCVMLPLSYFLTFTCELGLIGIWLGMTTAWTTATMIYAVVILRTDWPREVELARQRNEAGLHGVKPLHKSNGLDESDAGGAPVKADVELVMMHKARPVEVITDIGEPMKPVSRRLGTPTRRTPHTHARRLTANGIQVIDAGLA